MRTGWAIILGLALAAGCGGQIGAGNGTSIAVFELQSDDLGALQLKDCLSAKGPRDCARYPNPDECKSMTVSVGEDASIKAECLLKDGTRSELAKGGLSVPFRCSASKIAGVRCVDIFSKVVLNPSGWQLPPELQSIQNRAANTEAIGNETVVTSTEEPSPCTAAHAVKTFATELNNLMAKYNLLRIYTPKNTSGNALTQIVDAVGVCNFTALENARLNGIPTPICRDAFGQKICRCAYMDNIAMNETCKKMKAQCANKGDGWEGALWLEAGNASLFLANPSYKSTEAGQSPGSGSGGTSGSGTGSGAGSGGTSGSGTGSGAGSGGGVGQAPDDTGTGTSGGSTGSGNTGTGCGTGTGGAGGTGTGCGTGTGSSPNDTNGTSTPGGSTPGGSTPGGSTPGGSTPGTGIPNTENICTGSPLVLDLENDGIETTSLEDGVRFDLLGKAPVRTAWLKEQDAFLAIDRNGNGRIDGGAELFGEASTLDNQAAANGFDALASVDSKRHGGNDDGVVNGKDKLWKKLVLWTDRNHDGASQPDELKSLTKSGIRELKLQATYQVNALDRHGNDLGLRGTFVRKDGSTGAMVDVYFNYRSEIPGLFADRND